MTNDEIVQTAELGDLLSGLARAVVQAQDVLDEHASAQAAAFVALPDGTLEVPPLWYTMKTATVELEMSATVRESRLVCGLVNPSTVGLFGREAATGARVRLVIGPSGVVPIKTTEGGAK